MCDSKQKSSYEYGSDFERLPRYGKKKIRTIRSKSDPCSYELFCLESHILSFPKVLQIPPESPYIYIYIYIHTYIHTYIYTHTQLLPPDDGQLASPKHVEV